MNSKSHMGNHVASLYVKDVVRTPDAHDGRRACVPVPALFHENSSLERPFARIHAPCPGNMSSFSAPFLSACSKVISFRMQVPPKVGFSPAHRRAAECFPPLCRKYPCPSCPHGMVPERSLQNLLKCRFFHFHRQHIEITNLLQNNPENYNNFVQCRGVIFSTFQLKIVPAVMPQF